MRRIVPLFICLAAAACRDGNRAPVAPEPAARNLLVITVDALRADRVGAYGYRAAKTPAMDQLARDGVRFRHAYATAPMTLTSHASLMTGRYPSGHGARHHAMPLDLKTPTLADTLSRAGFATGAFIGADSLNRRFGLIKGFQAYGDRMPRGPEGRPGAERAGREVVGEALRWLDSHRRSRFFLWIHLFEPHAPHGDPANANGRSASDRYDDEVALADKEVARLIGALGTERSSTLVVLASDHGEAFGEHGEFAHGLFVYDTTLRVPLVIAGPDLPRARTVDGPVTLMDVAPTVLSLLGVTAFDVDGIDLGAVMSGSKIPDRELYAESLAPLLDFGWSPLHALRAARWKYIAAPRPELYDIAADPGETRDVSSSEAARVADLQARTAARAGAPTAAPGNIARPDPKDRRNEASTLAHIDAGELRGRALEQALRDILHNDPHNPHASLRLGHLLLESNRCREAMTRFGAAIAARLPSADAHLGLAACEAAARRFGDAAATLREAERVEPENPVVMARLGAVLSDGGHPADAIDPLQRALTIDPDLHQARLHLAAALARTGRREESAATARELLRRLPPGAPLRTQAERLAAGVQ